MILKKDLMLHILYVLTQCIMITSKTTKQWICFKNVRKCPNLALFHIKNKGQIVSQYNVMALYKVGVFALLQNNSWTSA